MNLQLTGIHHVSAVSGDPKRNLAFYTQQLGMRLVKRTVNQDDVKAYHLFYADAKGSPGTDLTFFAFENAISERYGTHSIVNVGLRISESSVKWWDQRLAQLRIEHGRPLQQGNRTVIPFRDFEGQRFTLVGDKESLFYPWNRSPVPREHQIHGLGPVTLSIPELSGTEETLLKVMQLRKVSESRLPGSPRGSLHVYVCGEGGLSAELRVRVEPGMRPAQPGAGGVHHVAFRVPDDEQHRAWFQRLQQARIPHSGIIDRFYFRSLYFREPNGILFELATDGPGFAVDEAEDRLGESLALPPFLEARRAEIEAGLKPLDSGV